MFKKLENKRSSYDYIVTRDSYVSILVDVSMQGIPIDISSKEIHFSMKSLGSEENVLEIKNTIYSNPNDDAINGKAEIVITKNNTIDLRENVQTASYFYEIKIYNPVTGGDEITLENGFIHVITDL